jgi:hypothetical protein
VSEFFHGSVHNITVLICANYWWQRIYWWRIGSYSQKGR